MFFFDRIYVVGNRGSELLYSPDLYLKDYGIRKQFHYTLVPIRVYKCIYKDILLPRINGNCLIATLLIHARTLVCTGYWNEECDNKKRARCATVESITDLRGNAHDHGYSIHDPTFEYKVGDLVLPRKDFCTMSRYDPLLLHA